MRISIFLLLVPVLFVSCKNKQREISEEEFRSTQEQLVNVNRILVEKDAEKIAAYAERRGWNMEETETGLWYMIDEPGNGEPAHTGQLATINYEISLLDGTVCYSSSETGPKQFEIGKGGVESGLEEGIMFMHEGGKAKFIMPPHLAHGLVGDENRIPTRAIIVYDVELIKLD